jgi:type II secretory pathway component PulK
MKASSQRGSLVLVALGVISVVSIFALMCVQNIALRHAGLRVSANWQRARSIADAGVESAIAALKKDPYFKGENDTAFDGGSFSTAVSRLATEEDGWVIRSRSLFKTRSQGPYRKELVIAVRLLEGKLEVVSRDENTPIH